MRTADARQRPGGKTGGRARRAIGAAALAGAVVWLSGAGVAQAADRGAAQRGAAPADSPVVAMRLHPSIRALSATLANGVHVHHRFMPYRQGQATVEIALVGGRSGEDAAAQGLTEAGVGALVHALRGRLAPPAADIAALDEQNIAISAWAGPRAVHVRLTGPTDRLPTALNAIADAIAHPQFASADFDAFVESRRKTASDRGRGFFGVMWDAVSAALFSPEDADRLIRTPVERLERFGADDAQRWLEAVFATAPIEAALVGDAPRAEALDMLARSLGPLPTRDAAPSQRLAQAKPLVRRRLDGPVVAPSDAAGERALVWVSLETPPDLGVEGDAALDVLAEALPALLKDGRAAPGPEEDDAAIRVYHRDAGGVFATGSLTIHTLAPVNEARSLAARFAAALQGEALERLDDEALAQARRQTTAQREEQLREPQTWALLLVELGLRGVDPGEIASAQAAIPAVQLETVRAALQASLALGPPAQIIIIPATQGHDGE